MGRSNPYKLVLIMFLKLKKWRLLFMLLPLAAATSNLYLYKPKGIWKNRSGESNLYSIGPKEFQADNILVGDVAGYSTQFSMLTDAVTRMSQVDFEKKNMEPCDSKENCLKKYFKLIMSKWPGKYTHYVDFNFPSKTANIMCQLSVGSELYCPFVAYLVGVTQDKDPLAKTIQYNTLTMFRLMSQTLTQSTGPRKKDTTICASEINIVKLLSKTLTVQMMFLLLTLVFYLLVSTVSCIYELKQSGFLQLMFSRRLSVWPYWLSLWMVTFLEMAIVAAVLTIAHHLQCPGFYSAFRLLTVFFMALLQFCCIAASTLLMTVLTKKAAIASLSACFLHVIPLTSIFFNYIVWSKDPKLFWVNYLLLVYPYALSPDQLLAALFKNDAQFNPLFSFVLPQSILVFGLLFCLTIYMDCVTEAGNGRKLPFNFLFLPHFWSIPSADRKEIVESNNSFMIEMVSPIYLPQLRTHKLNKSIETRRHTTIQLQDFSETFYQDQITSIVGHNGSGKSTLLQILSGDQLPTKGEATISNLLITDPVDRNHLSNDIGYCPQADALVDRLTVLDTLSLIAVSSGLSWDDIQEDVISVLTVLQIETKLNDHISSLSNGEKRMLCVTMALVGKPKVVLLDCPARDLDYVSKRRLWKLLLEYKKGRVVIMSTLFIDEAEEMADRIIFLSGGRVICAGSPFFLRRALDCRFIIQIASRTEFHVTYLWQKLVKKFPSLRVRSTDQTNIEIEVSLLDDKILPLVVLEIENMAEFIDEFGIVNYTLDDVYSKLKQFHPSEMAQHVTSSTIGFIADDVDRIKALKSQREVAVPDGPAKVKVAPLVVIIIFAMLNASFLQLKRSIERVMVRVFVPIFLLLLLILSGIIEKFIPEEMILLHNLNIASQLDTNYGVCLYILSTVPHYDMIDDAQCARMLFNRTGTHTIKSIALPYGQYKPEEFSRNLLNENILPKVNSFCRKGLSPCPLIYAHNWCPDLLSPVTEQHVYIGTYISNWNETLQTATATSLEVMSDLYSEMTRAHIQFLRSTQVAVNRRSFEPSYKVQGVVDPISIGYPLYGMFIQTVLLVVLPSIHLTDIIHNKKNGVYRQLVSMGMSRFHYWFSTLVNHWLQLALLYILSTICLIILGTRVYMTVLYAVSVFIPTLILGLTNSLLCVYALSFAIKNYSFLYVATYSFFMLLIALSPLIERANKMLSRILIFSLPQYAIIAPTFYGTRFMHYTDAFFVNSAQPDLFELISLIPHFRDTLIALSSHFVLLILLLVVLEKRILLLFKPSPTSLESGYGLSGDEFVIKEAEKIEKNPKNQLHIMEANKIQLENSKGKMVLQNLTFGLKRGEIFGLLGPYGAGKSSAIRAIVNDKSLSTGQVDFQVGDCWLSNASAVQRHFIGYCPSYNPLFDWLTVLENLHFYARSIGVSSIRVDEVLWGFSLKNESNSVVLHVTTGVKRRLSLAIAALTSPLFLAIDEPSDGVDFEGRKLIWQAIKSLAGKRRGMVVATHQMDEAEYLCGRISIMNKGLMTALCDIDQLIARYKTMYFIEMLMNQEINESYENFESKKEKIIDIILKKFPGSIVSERLNIRVQIGVPIKSLGTFSSAISWLLQQKKDFNLQFITIHYATIDQTMKTIIAFHESEMYKKKESDLATTTVDEMAGINAV